MNDKIQPSEVTTCKNCETEFSGNYCPECGQSRKDYDKPFRFIIVDFAGNIFAFDTRIWNTVKKILLRPGQLAKDFVEGKRARYMPPFRFYVFISFIFFLLLSQTSNDSIRVNIGSKPAVSDSMVAEQSAPVGTPEMGNVKGQTNFLGRKIDWMDVNSHKEMYMAKFMQWLSSSFFLLMPVYAFLLWLFFRRKYRYYLGHLILAINQHAFIFLIFIILLALHILLPHRNEPPERILLLFIPVYCLLGARKMYGRRWISTFFRMALIWFIYILVVSVCMVVVAFFAFST